MTRKPLRRRTDWVDPAERLEIDAFDDAPLHAEEELDMLPSDLERLRRGRSERPPPPTSRIRLSSGR
ncbi:MAG: hypothetical protein IT379_38225 [Deltaproteobacteria bacterium]|nr:hypothetical protein [Deltaproteobacteria bacterium]